MISDILYMFLELPLLLAMLHSLLNVNYLFLNLRLNVHALKTQKVNKNYDMILTLDGNQACA